MCGHRVASEYHGRSPNSQGMPWGCSWCQRSSQWPALMHYVLSTVSLMFKWDFYVHAVLYPDNKRKSNTNAEYDHMLIIWFKSVYVVCKWSVLCEKSSPSESIWCTGPSGEVNLTVSGLNTFGLSAWGREIGVMLHQHLTLMPSWEESPSGGSESRETTQVYRASLEA